MADIRNDRPLLFGDFLIKNPDIRYWLQKESELDEKVRLRHAQFAALDEQMTAIRKAHFKSPENDIKALLKNARDTALSPAEKAICEDFESAWKSQIAELIDNQDRKLQAIIDKISTSLSKVDWVRGDAESLRAKQIAEIEDMVKEGSGVTGCSPPIAEAFGSLVASLADREKEEKERLKVGNAIRSASDVTTYLAALRAYCERFPRDPMADAVKGILRRENDYKLFTAFQPISSPEAFQVQLLSRTNDIGLDNYFWSSILLQFVAQEDRVNSKWAEVQAAITALGEDKTLADIYSFSVLPTCKLVYSQGSFSGKVFIPSLQNPEKAKYVVTGSIYIPGASDRMPRFAKRSVDVPTTDIDNLKKMSHCAAINELIGDVQGCPADKAALLLLGKMKGIYADSRYPSPYLKLKVTKFLAGQLVQMLPAHSIPKLELALREMTAADNEDFSWLCTANTDMAVTCAKANQVLAASIQNAAFAAEYQFSREIARRTLLRGVKWCGFVDMKGHIVFSGSARPAELWALRGKAAGHLHVEVVADITPNKTYQILSALQPCEPLFAPGDGARTATILQEIVQTTGVPLAMLDTFGWPLPWPSNRRSLPGPERTH